jgi:two-component system, LuxR family, response regulator FixJ
MSESPIARGEIVYIVDDDPDVLKAVSRQLRSNGWRVEPFESAEAFLENRERQDMACLVLDVSLPGLDGIELQRQLLKTREAIPIVFLTGHGDIPMSVRAIQAGASNFLTKPVTAADLCAAIRRAMDEGAKARCARAEADRLGVRFARLTPREREIFQAVAAGKLNKQIAGELGIVEQTVKFHRARIMERMEAHTSAELMRMAAKLAIGEDT